MAQFVPAGIKLVAVGVESFRASMAVANQAREQFSAGVARTNAAGLASDVRDIGVAAVATATGISLMTAAAAEFVATTSGFASIRFAADVQRDAKFMQAVLQATDQDMQRLLATAESLGSNVPTAFRDIISQLRELGRAGISIDDINAKAAKLTASLSILARGEASPQKIAESLSAGAASFTRGTDSPTAQLDAVAQSILGVANATRLSIPEVINAFSKSAPQAGLFKATAEELGAFIALVGAAGIRGEEAGTGIRNFLLRLANPSKEAAEQMQRFGISAFDATGAVRPLRDIIANLQQVYSDEAIALSGVTEAQRAYSLSQIFQTRTAAVAALAISRGTAAYDEYLAVIQDTDPINQAAIATDNLLDRIQVLINRARILGNTFGQAVLPGLRTFVNQIDTTIGDVSDPTNRFRQAAGALGSGISSLFTGEGIGQSADALEAQFGSTVANVFESIAQGAARVREVITSELIPSVGAFFDALGRLSVGTIFNPGAVNSFSDAIINATSFLSQLLRISVVIIDSIGRIAPVASAMASSIASVIGNVFTLLGHLVNGFIITIQDVSGGLLRLSSLFREIKSNADPAGAIAFTFGKLANVFDSAGTSLGNFIQPFSDTQANLGLLNTRIQETSSVLQEAIQKEQGIRQISSSIRVWEEQLRGLERAQLAEEGPDVSDQINSIQLIIDALREERRVLAGVVDSNDATSESSKAAAAALAAYDKAVQDATAGFRDFNAEESEARRQQQEIITSTRRLGEVYNDLERSVARSTREAGDRIDDLVARTDRALTKLSSDTLERIDDIRRNLAVANADAAEAFDFETGVRNQRAAVQQAFEDIGTAASRVFDTQRRQQQDLIEDRERGRQREQQQITDALQRQIDENVRANSEINEDYSRSLQQRNEDLQRNLQRQHQLQLEQLSESFRVQNEARSRTNEDASRQRQLARDLAKAKTDEERRSIRERFGEETTNITERRQLETTEAAIRKQQEQQLQQVRRSQEQETLNVTRSLAKQELDIRRTLARQEREFRLVEELRLFFVRVGLEERFISETRRLREQADIPAANALQDRQTAAGRQIQVAQTEFDDFFRLQQFLRDLFLRERGAGRQEEEVLSDAERRQNEIIQNAVEEQTRIIREAEQKRIDLQAQAVNTAGDIRGRVGTGFPALDQFLGRLPSLFGGAGAAQQGILGGDLSSRLSIPALTGPTGAVQSQVTPELLALAVVPMATLSTRFTELTGAVTTLTTELQRRAGIGSTNVEIDDFNINDSVILGEGALNRVANLAAGALAQAVASRGGR